MHQNPEKAKAIERTNYENFTKGKFHKYNFRSNLLKVTALEKIGLFDLLDRDDWFSSSDKQAAKILRKAQKDKTYKLAFGRHPAKTKSVIAFLREALERIGCSLESTRTKVNGKQVYRYRVWTFWEKLPVVYHFVGKHMELLYAQTLATEEEYKKHAKAVLETPLPQGLETRKGVAIYESNSLNSNPVYGNPNSQQATEPKTWQGVLRQVATDLFIEPDEGIVNSIRKLFTGIIQNHYPAPPVYAWYDTTVFSEKDIAQLDEIIAANEDLEQLYEKVLELGDDPDSGELPF
jgi:hypothetical protein